MNCCLTKCWLVLFLYLEMLGTSTYIYIYLYIYIYIYIYTLVSQNFAIFARFTWPKQFKPLLVPVVVDSIEEVGTESYALRVWSGKWHHWSKWNISGAKREGAIDHCTVIWCFLIILLGLQESQPSIEFTGLQDRASSHRRKSGE